MLFNFFLPEINNTSMYEVFQWDDHNAGGRSSPHSKHGTCTEPATPVHARSREPSRERHQYRIPKISQSEFCPLPVEHHDNRRLPLSVYQDKPTTTKRHHRNESSLMGYGGFTGGGECD